MDILFALFVVVVLALGLINRKKYKREWVKDERREESGDWIDKRAGERGTWGSLDEEMDSARKNVVREGRVAELTRQIRAYAFEHYPGFNDLSDEQIRHYTAFLRSKTAQLIATIDQLLAGRAPDPAPGPPPTDPHVLAVQRQILEYAYRHYPALLDLGLETIRAFDGLVGRWAEEVMGGIREIREIKGN